MGRADEVVCVERKKEQKETLGLGEDINDSTQP